MHVQGTDIRYRTYSEKGSLCGNGKKWNFMDKLRDPERLSENLKGEEV